MHVQSFQDAGLFLVGARQPRDQELVFDRVEIHGETVERVEGIVEGQAMRMLIRCAELIGQAMDYSRGTEEDRLFPDVTLTRGVV